jgi:hypothetical protein
MTVMRRRLFTVLSVLSLALFVVLGLADLGGKSGYWSGTSKLDFCRIRRLTRRS